MPTLEIVERIELGTGSEQNEYIVSAIKVLATICLCGNTMFQSENDSDTFN